MLYRLRGYQTRGFDAARGKIAAGFRAPLIVSPTGSGKTVLGAAIIDKAVAKQTRCLFLAHRKELIDQCSRKVDEIGLHDHGVIKRGHWRFRPFAPVQIASVQTLVRRLDTLDMNYGLIITDEAHHAAASTYRKIMDAAPADVVHLGLTATPYRSDGKGLGDIFDCIVEVATVPELIEQGHLVSTRVFAGQPPDVSKVKKVRGDYNAAQLATASDKATLRGDILKNWKLHAADRTTVCFAVTVEHSKHIADMFLQAGIPAAHLDGGMGDAERDDILGKLEADEIKIVCNCGILTEGWDLPQTSAVILARATASRGLWRQMVGRALRPAPGKDHCILLDHAGATYMHGFVTDPDELCLSTGLKKERTSRTYNCPSCNAELRSWPNLCPSCGVELPRKQKREQEIKHDLEAEMREITEREVSVSKRREYIEICQQVREDGLHPTAALKIFHKKFGHAPRKIVSWQDDPITFLGGSNGRRVPAWKYEQTRIKEAC